MSLHTHTHRSAPRGFTLLEIIVVVMIIAVLATLIAPRLLSRVGTARQAAAKAKAATIRTQVNLYFLDLGISSPSDDFTLDLLLLGPDDGGAPGGPFLEREDDLIDPWENPFEILIPGDVNKYSFDIISWGEDGEQGGEGANEDIVQ